MKRTLKPYVSLMRRLADREISADVFSREYISAFKEDSTKWKDDVFDVLDAVFALADCYVPDPDALARLRAKHPGSKFYVDDQELTEKVKMALKRLEAVR